jgi:hypothetical protein
MPSSALLRKALGRFHIIGKFELDFERIFIYFRSMEAEFLMQLAHNLLPHRRLFLPC